VAPVLVVVVDQNLYVLSVEDGLHPPKAIGRDRLGLLIDGCVQSSIGIDEDDWHHVRLAILTNRPKLCNTLGSQEVLHVYCSWRGQNRVSDSWLLVYSGGLGSYPFYNSCKD
jgi:hypothetical protein